MLNKHILVWGFGDGLSGRVTFEVRNRRWPAEESGETIPGRDLNMQRSWGRRHGVPSSERGWCVRNLVDKKRGMAVGLLQVRRGRRQETE